MIKQLLTWLFPPDIARKTIERYGGMHQKSPEEIIAEIRKQIFRGRFGELSLSQDDAIYLHLAWQRDDVRKLLIADGFDQQAYEKVLQFLTPESMKWAEYIDEEIASSS